jgi:hypothetical protein
MAQDMAGTGSGNLFDPMAEPRASEPSTPGNKPWQSHSINIRLSLPLLPGQRIYVSVVGGVEKRAKSRLQEERKSHPLLTMGNFLFVLGVGAAFYMAAIFALFVFSAFQE